MLSFCQFSTLRYSCDFVWKCTHTALSSFLEFVNFALGSNLSVHSAGTLRKKIKSVLFAHPNVLVFIYVRVCEYVKIDTWFVGLGTLQNALRNSLVKGGKIAKDNYVCMNRILHAVKNMLIYKYYKSVYIYYRNNGNYF